MHGPTVMLTHCGIENCAQHFEQRIGAPDIVGDVPRLLLPVRFPLRDERRERIAQLGVASMRVQSPIG